MRPDRQLLPGLLLDNNGPPPDERGEGEATTSREGGEVRHKEDGDKTKPTERRSRRKISL